MRKIILALSLAALLCLVGLVLNFGFGRMRKVNPQKMEAGLSEYALALYEEPEEEIQKPEGPLLSSHFVTSTMQSFLAAGEKRENRLYTPMNLFGVTASLAAMSEGNTRAQLQAILGEEDLDKTSKTLQYLTRKYNPVKEVQGAQVDTPEKES